MKYEWRKKEKSLYLPKAQPTIINIPEFQYLTIDGTGSPESPMFTTCIEALYALSYAIKMTLKQLDQQPEGYMDYTVFPLEGIWDINDKAKKNFTGKIDKNDFVYKLMIRQPSFVTSTYFEEMRLLTKRKKSNPLLDSLKWDKIEDGLCVQMMHLGSYDNESESFEIMEAFAAKEGLIRMSKIHREIYLTDFRKVPSEKLRTVLRFKAKSK